MYTFILAGVAWTVVSFLMGYWVAPMMSDRAIKGKDNDGMPFSGPEFRETRKIAIIALRDVARQMRDC